ncbi:rhomboid-related protein 3 isoform X2 [Chiloscyllium plagiosum]|uniref:rhomboid-related protein 3 isoform X2 n=1 Tax=Chiloscyllium plagiosum TaxID=36176 RepID=UPI001CB850F6|nr:rhomboid-related protein 3 isoform X2 [Chiloscyllium plagiosum]
MSNKRSNSFCRAIHLGNRHLRANSLLEETGLTISQRFIRHIAYETLPRGLDRKWYYDSYTCCPPPWFMITVTLLEIAVFIYYGLVLEKWVLQITHPSYLNNPLVYQPQLRRQIWRYLSYIFMHVGVEHLGFNVVLQLLVGVPLEMVHGALRISFIYLAGVLAVSLEFGRAVWLRFHPATHPSYTHPSFVTHLGGVMVGITLGVVVLRNYEQRLHEQSIWWIFLLIYLLFVFFAVLWNIFAYNLLEIRLLSPA